MTKFIVSLAVMALVVFPAFAARSSFYHLGRRFTIFVPKGKPANRPLLVVLHGCKQNADLMLSGSQLEAEAEAKKFVILAPEQPSFANIDRCWNWFLPVNQSRGGFNEMEQIISGIEKVKASYRIDSKRVFLTGISAGGVMSHNLTVCYPDIFAGAAIHSGLTYKVAESIPEAQTVLSSYEQKTPSYLGKKAYECGRDVDTHRLLKVMIIHGMADSRVPSFHSELISKSQEVWRDYLDDGKKNNSVRILVRNEVLKFPNGYSAEKVTSEYPDFTEVRLMIRDLGHAWGGGRPVSVNFDPKAPSSNKFILDFFNL